MNYKDIIASSLQKHGPESINMHKIENNFIMDINYELLVDVIVDNLNSAGYTIINKQQ